MKYSFARNLHGTICSCSPGFKHDVLWNSLDVKHCSLKKNIHRMEILLQGPKWFVERKGIDSPLDCCCFGFGVGNIVKLMIKVSAQVKTSQGKF